MVPSPIYIEVIKGNERSVSTLQKINTLDMKVVGGHKGQVTSDGDDDVVAFVDKFSCEVRGMARVLCVLDLPFCACKTSGDSRFQLFCDQ